MSTKQSSRKNSGINWPKTPARLAEEFQQRQDTITAVATVGQIMTAASAVPVPRQKKLITEAIQAATEAQPLVEKKTGNRKQRTHKEHSKAYFETNQAWSEVEGIRMLCLDLLRTASALSPMLRQKELLLKVTNIQLLTRNILAIGRDTQTLHEVLQKTHALHKDKTGGSIDQEDMFLACTVYSEYVDFMERYDAALMPLVVHASEQLQEALIKLEHSNPELATNLNYGLNNNLASIRAIIHENTGADEIVTPGMPAQLTLTEAPNALAAA